MADLKAPLDRVLDRCIETAQGCWEFQGAKARGGYGFVRVAGKNKYTHRVAYEAMVVEIPEGLQIDHLCRNPPCCNPWHMDPVTAQVNTLRGNTIQAKNAKKTHCLRGHPFAGDNLHISPRGQRICRACKRLWVQKRRGRKAA